MAALTTGQTVEEGKSEDLPGRLRVLLLRLWWQYTRHEGMWGPGSPSSVKEGVIHAPAATAWQWADQVSAQKLPTPDPQSLEESLPTIDQCLSCSCRVLPQSVAGGSVPPRRGEARPAEDVTHDCAFPWPPVQGVSCG